ncbi:LysR substrate-binding domain-containing protein [Nocardia sp. NPDC056064]|uniref:LysR substrate-binding domain-containing protein n=1 Tax=Nocardia sp. NPDC056064 TaxID=3345701 RepID=UPI0035D589C8
MRLMHSGMSLSNIDLNLLVALDALLEEGSVNGAAARLHLSGPAMSRTLGRIRIALADPILVRTGRSMTPTPRAVAIRSEVRELVERVGLLFAPVAEIEPSTLVREFAIQIDEALVAVFGGELLAAVARTAPGVSLRFLGEGAVTEGGLRGGAVDLEVGQITGAAPEVLVEPLFADRIVAIVRPGHRLADGAPTVRDFAAADHLSTSRRGRRAGPIDAALAELGLRRRVVASAPNFTAGLFLVRDSDLVGVAGERAHRGLLASLGLVSVPVLLPVPPVEIAMAWHPRHAADGEHRWLRERVRDVFAPLAAMAGEV